MQRAILTALALVCCLFGDEEYIFRGKHFVASYMGCDLRSLTDLEGLIEAMNEAVRSSGATILNMTPYVFPPNGLTIVYLLQESHASLHTYPEHGACFADLFTCGDVCSAKKFDEILRKYLQPKFADVHQFLRDDSVQEIPFTQ